MAGTPLVVLLRGVNVNGITVRSAPLTASMLSIDGVDSARTLLASGNVVVRTRLDAATLKAAAEAALRRDVGYDAWVVVVPQSDLAQVVEATPWPDDDPATHVYLTFASDPAALDTALERAHEGGIAEVARPAPGVLAWRAPKGGTLDSPVSKLLARPAYKRSTTTRNLRTVVKLRDLRP